MARIRTIKPEFWRSPDTAAASPVARLLFIAMWNWADDAGRGEADLKSLEGFAFPNDDVRELSGGTSENFRHVLAEVVECFGLTLYMVDGRPYYEIPSWQRHQRNERTAKGKHPHPNEGVTCTVDEIGGKRRNFRHSPTESPQTSGPGTGEQGNRGTGEQGVPHASVIVTGARDEREPDDDHPPALVHDDGAPTPAGIITEWERASGTPLTDSTRAAMRLSASQCLRAGHDPQTIAQGLADWASSKMTHPNQIPGFVDRAAVRPKLTAVPASAHNADGWLALGGDQ